MDSNTALTDPIGRVAGPEIGMFSLLINTFENMSIRNVWTENPAGVSWVNWELSNLHHGVNRPLVEPVLHVVMRALAFVGGLFLSTCLLPSISGY